MEKKKLTKQDITATDVMYIVFSIILGFCFIACAVVCIFLLVCCLIYLVKSFSLESAKVFKAFALTILMLLSTALFSYLDYVIFKTMKKSIQDYIIERKEILNEIENKEKINE